MATGLERNASIANILNTTLVSATTDAEEAVLTPAGAPRIGADPVLHAVLSAVADDLDSVSALIATCSMVVDTAGVGHEIGVDLKGNLEGTILRKLGHHIGLTRDGVVVLALVLVGVPDKGRIASALIWTARLGSRAGRIALLRDDASLDPVAPDAVGPEVSHFVAVRAGVDVHHREHEIVLVLEDAHTIAHGLNCDQRPSSAGHGLSVDGLHGDALGPLLTSIEAFGGGKTLGTSVSLRGATMGKMGTGVL